MAIDRTQGVSPLTSIQQREPSEASVQNTRKEGTVSGTTTSGTAVTLSSAQASLTQSSAQDINTARVEELKQAIRDGKLTMDTGKIADALLQDTQDYLKGL
ncbi:MULTISPECIES: flagellar biosynthesis anti-sigma factor FlgM [Rahnella]|uniref:Negative regulator of flagellin synthesis n=1 Tax=Rahnella sp. (strain Y9602) TaxID=2703885 RepID=A0A0H3F956_RAHSY|nr:MULTISPECIES: flagellar biosynthesis anti-sigma factor FlgM [Rahnella]AYA09346.1 anti-sigma-28 factor FlgM [Rahnella aquatilis]ADW73459.1 Anti-sigma-28 factor FlgM family protein [Rahnella aceris]AZP41905.1 anti-sigma-28 factor FlgM [Rahnella aquatilis]AZP46246.1 anti-sigma-28 factor FlgM [Rahnella aquatilis]AZP50719.1 anti-sigma-28 factor FlgM [Rahnella aquatilis]